MVQVHGAPRKAYKGYRMDSQATVVSIQVGGPVDFYNHKAWDVKGRLSNGSSYKWTMLGETEVEAIQRWLNWFSDRRTGFNLLEGPESVKFPGPSWRVEFHDNFPRNPEEFPEGPPFKTEDEARKAVYDFLRG